MSNQEYVKVVLSKYEINEIGSLLITVRQNMDQMIQSINWQDKGNLVNKAEAIDRTYNIINNYYNGMIENTNEDKFTLNFDFSSIIVIYSIFFTFDVNRKKSHNERTTIYTDIADTFNIYE